MKINWVDIILIVMGLFIAYQILRTLFGGSWQFESLIIAFLVFNFTLLWKLNTNIWKLNMKFSNHII